MVGVVVSLAKSVHNDGSGDLRPRRVSEMLGAASRRVVSRLMNSFFMVLGCGE